MRDRRFRSDAATEGSFAPSIAPGKLPTTARYVARAATGGAIAADASERVDRAGGSGGSGLPSDLRSRFESSLGTDLGGVRLHTGAASADAAASVGARAYAVGQDVHFGAGQYNPTSSDGQFLIAHEVAHTVQQRGGAANPQFKLETSTPGDAAEVEADRAASAMVSGAPASVSAGGLTIARQVDPLGANMTYEVEGGERERLNVQTDGKGNVKAASETILFQKSLTKPAGAGMYCSVALTVRFVVEAEGKKDGASEETGQTGKFVVDGTGSIGIGVGNGDKKAGAEGQIQVSGEAAGTLGRDKMIEGNPRLNLIAKVNLALVAQASDNAKANATKTLSQLLIWTGILAGNELKPDPGWCNEDMVKKAADDLVDNGGALGLWGAPGVAWAAYQDYKQGQGDDAAAKEFEEHAHDNDQQMGSDQSDQFMASQTRIAEAQAAAYASPATAERERDAHEQFNDQLKRKQALVAEAMSPFNGVRDQSWWKGSAFAKFNEGTVHRMKGDGLYAKYQQASGTNDVSAAAAQVNAEYDAAITSFKAAQAEQYGKEVAG